MNIILDKLFEQYKNALGLTDINKVEKEILLDFKCWLKCRQLMGLVYKSFIEKTLEIDFSETSSTAEVGKCNLDSIALQTNLSIITQYSNGFDFYTGQMNKSKLTIIDGNPVITSNIGNIKFLNLLDGYDRFITQNPYSENDIRNWEQLVDNGYDITVGVFGSIDDKDIDKKINQIEDLNKKITGLKDVFAVTGDTYCYAISSNNRKY